SAPSSLFKESIMERLQCHVQNYAWGKKGMNSEVARIYAAGHDTKIDSDKSYAELWMGTHPDGPARVKRTNMKLSSYITESEKSVYERNAKETHLPFIMKLMSIEKTLSLQVHPTKEQAARLNDRDPAHYPDRNHKPELAYALTRFELLCGFRPAVEISRNISAFPELEELMGDDTSKAFQTLVRAGISEECATTKAALAVCFKKLIHARKDTRRVCSLINSFLHRLDNGERGCLTEATVEVIRKMAVDFPGDVGIFSPLFLNHIILEPGECCYYAAEELHAYLSGECVECVGCSNNTIRAACTPKYIDVDALCEVLNYRMGDPSYYLVPPMKLRGFEHVNEYAPDCKDFTLHEIKIASPSGNSPVPIPSLACGSIMVVVEGEAQLENLSERGYRRDKRIQVTRGDIIYIAPGSQLCFFECQRDILAYRTFSYEHGPDHSQRNTTDLMQPVIGKLKVQKKGRAKYLVVDEDAEIFDVETEMDGIC
uniref:mannose-6-phosphate isomerase n=1 Tax=Parascaris univalens TaxID=6257 RepID=A0A915AHT3_PARUN